jgi:hypothetical protein
MPHHSIQSPCYDTCGEYTIFKNVFRYREEKNKHVCRPVDEFSDNKEVDLEEAQENDWEGITQEQETSNIVESFFAGESASYHVEQEKLMHELAQKGAQGAKEDHNNNIRHANKRYCLVYDYAKNLGIPHFRSEQPGDTYYYSPLTLHMLGIVDLSHSPHRLECYCYCEFTGKRGEQQCCPPPYELPL